MDNSQLEEKRRETQEEAPVFWQELYWFAVICLGGIALALLVLAPRLSQVRDAQAVEARLRTTVARLDHLEKQYESAIQALETDPFYRDEVLRAVLNVKKNDEEFLKTVEPGPGE